MLEMDLIVAVVEQIGSVLEMDLDLVAVVEQQSELSGCLD